jgi:CcmD family protein
MNYLLIANICVWVGVGGYLLFLAGRQAALERRVRQLEILDGSNE